MAGSAALQIMTELGSSNGLDMFGLVPHRANPSRRSRLICPSAKLSAGTALAGILAYTGNAEAFPVLLKGLRALSYEGTDSWGLCTCDGSLHVRRFVGRPSDSDAARSGPLPGLAGMVHTRWATLGSVAESNAHPVLDCTRSMAVVHNGFVENGQAIRSDLVKKGHAFCTQTDTEVIPHLVEELERRGSSLPSAVAQARAALEGSFSFALISARDPGTIYACRNHHPLYIGTSSSSSIATSEPACLPGAAYRARILGSEEMAILQPGAIKTVPLSPESGPSHPWTSVDRQYLADRRMGYRHFLEKEILREPDVLMIMGLGDLMDLELFADSVEHAARVHILADSSSYYSCLIASYLLHDIAKVYSKVLPARDFLSSKERLSGDDLILAMRSNTEGGMIDEALQYARARGAHTALVTSNGAGKLGLGTVLSIGKWGAKNVSPMGAYVGQVGVSLLLAHAVRGSVDRGRKELGELGESLKKRLPQLRNRAHQEATRLCSSETILLFGRNLAHTLALEGSNELTSLAKVRSLGLENPRMGDTPFLRPGPRSGCIFYARKGDEGLLDTAKEAETQGTRVVDICEEGVKAPNDAIIVPESKHLFAVSGVLPTQLLAYELSVLRGNDPDRLAFTAADA